MKVYIFVNILCWVVVVIAGFDAVLVDPVEGALSVATAYRRNSQSRTTPEIRRLLLACRRTF